METNELQYYKFVERLLRRTLREIHHYNPEEAMRKFKFLEEMYQEFGMDEILTKEIEELRDICE